MGVKKIVMLAILVSFVAGCAPLHPSNCHKTTALGSCSSGRWDDRKRLVRTVLIFTESSDQLSRATDRVPGLPASPGYVQ